ncbi:MAG: GtrA family protein [Clostridia bacterium]|nr:GtrA family protein [Clostridia bacterium]
MDTIKNYYKKYEEIIKYLFFGVLTTVVNYVVYYAIVFMMHTSSGMIGFLANLFANLSAIIFAYVTNRKFVFDSKATGRKEIFKEMASFFSCRVFAMIVDSLIYYIGCTTMGFSDLIVKTISQVVIIILNYVLSKLVVFKKKDK